MRRPHTSQPIVKKLLLPLFGKDVSPGIASLPDRLVSDSGIAAGQALTSHPIACELPDRLRVTRSLASYPIACELPDRLRVTRACYHFKVSMLAPAPRFHGTFIEVSRASQREIAGREVK